MQVGRSPAFMEFAASQIRDYFAGKHSEGAWSVDDLHAHACRVHRSHIRAGADELAYALHIIVLRFGREWALIAVELTVADPMLGTKARTGHHGLRPDTSTASQAG
jgi:Zn-dependent M32 family carboxypeptidase